MKWSRLTEKQITLLCDWQIAARQWSMYIGSSVCRRRLSIREEEVRRFRGE